MDAKNFYGHTMKRVCINDLEGVQLQEDKLILYKVKIGKDLKNCHIQTDKAKIEQLLEILLYMGIYHNPQYRMYWSTNTPFAQITKALKGGVNRFEELKRFLHFSDMENVTTADYSNFDRLYKCNLSFLQLSKCNQIEPEEYSFPQMRSKWDSV